MRSESITVNALYHSARPCINTRPMGSCLYEINSSGCALGFICNRAERYRRYLFYNSAHVIHEKIYSRNFRPPIPLLSRQHNRLYSHLYLHWIWRCYRTMVRGRKIFCIITSLDFYVDEIIVFNVNFIVVIKSCFRLKSRGLLRCSFMCLSLLLVLSLLGNFGWHFEPWLIFKVSLGSVKVEVATQTLQKSFNKGGGVTKSGPASPI